MELTLEKKRNKEMEGHTWLKFDNDIVIVARKSNKAVPMALNA